ncbi:MAG: TSUP family transporter, partial [Saprospiraceae bacterium]
MLEIFGYLGAAAMGLSLGLIGGGGSILTVPILVFLFGIPVEIATAYSLFTVGLTSLVGSFSHVRMGNIHWRTAFVFGLPAILSVFATRRFIMPAIPPVLFRAGDFTFSKDIFILLVFAVLMVLAAASMIRQRKPQPAP